MSRMVVVLVVVGLIQASLGLDIECPTLQHLKTLIDAANNYRSVCEAKNFDDPSCTQYWSTMAQLVNSQTDYQTCAEQAEKNFRETLVGDGAAKSGLIIEEAVTTRNALGIAETDIKKDFSNKLNTALTTLGTQVSDKLNDAAAEIMEFVAFAHSGTQGVVASVAESINHNIEALQNEFDGFQSATADWNDDLVALLIHFDLAQPNSKVDMFQRPPFIDRVRAIVQDTVSYNKNRYGNVGDAEQYLSTAISALHDGDDRKAYAYFQAAYRVAVKER